MAEPLEVAQLGRSAIDVVDLGRRPRIATDAAAIVLCQHLLADLVAQSWPGVGQVKGEEGDHVAGDDQRSQRVGAAVIAYRLSDVADLLSLLAAVLRAEADVLLADLGRVERRKATGTQPNPPLLLHGHRARLLSYSRTKRLYWDCQHDGVRDRSISATTLSVSHREVPETASGWSRLRHK